MEVKLAPDKHWYIDARFGMFIHFGVYSKIGRGEWVRSREKMSLDEYKPYVEQFDPTKLDIEKWIDLAVTAGMKYIVLTAKHHDGFCLFDSKYSDYTVMNTPYGKDIIAEFVEKTRAAGLKVGLYFSLIDWHHEDYPKYNDRHHPMRGNLNFKDEKINWNNYIKFMHRQVEELVTKYGEIDIMWFDFSYDDMHSQMWKAQELMEMVRMHQPHIIIDNRLEGSGEKFGTIMDTNPEIFSGDFVSPEHIMPPAPILDDRGLLVPWEICTSINNSWGYHPNDKEYKTSKFIVRKLVEAVSKNGNVLLNVSPDGYGVINSTSHQILEEVGNWLNINGESVYENGPATNLPKPEWGYYTQKGNTIYAHIFDGPLGALPLPGIEKDQIDQITRLSDNSIVPISKSWTILSFPEVTFVDLFFDGTTSMLSDSINFVLKIEIKKDSTMI